MARYEVTKPRQCSTDESPFLREYQYGEMHSSSGRPSVGECRSELPCMPRALRSQQRLQQLWIILAPFLRFDTDQFRHSERRVRFHWRQLQAALVASGVAANLHARSSYGAYANP